MQRCSLKGRLQLWGLPSARSPRPAGVGVIGDITEDYGWGLLVSGKQSLGVLRWPRLLEHASEKLDGQLVLVPVSTWDQARRSLLRSATARALAGALFHHQEDCNVV